MNWRGLILFPLLAASFGATSQKVEWIRIDGAIGPATAEYVSRAIDLAASRKAQCLIVEMDTPGGLLDSTKIIVQKMLASPVPTVVYVSPSGASAASAGCFITLAASVAAMAPATNIGAAHPVSIGGGGATEQKPDEVMKQKLENYSVSYIQSIASRRNRNVEWAASAVKESASITAEKALQLHVIEIIAPDLQALLKQLDGRKVDERVLHTADAQVERIAMSPGERVFQALWRPEVMFILMLIAIYGIIGELSSPGAILPGVGGAIALVLMLYMASVLPVNMAGLALIGLAMALFVIDVFATTHGILTVGGLAAFFLGSLMLFNRAEPMYRLPLAMIIPATLLTAAFFFFVAGAGLRAQMMPVKVGRETLLGKTVAALRPIDQQSGKVFIEGEYWNAVSNHPVEQGRMVKVVGISGLTLKVEEEKSE